MGVKYAGVITVSFRGGLVRMMFQWRLLEDARKRSSGTGAGNGLPPPPPPGGASYGGPAYPIDPDEAALSKEWRMEKMKREVAQYKSERAVFEGRAPAFGFGGGDSGGAIGEAARAGKSGALPGAGATRVPTARGPYKEKVLL